MTTPSIPQPIQISSQSFDRSQTIDSSPASKKGVLFVNVGTPDHPRPPEVKKYLREFLMDPQVLDIPYLFRWWLVNVAILPKRSHASAEAYRKIWTERGSPLLNHLLDLATKTQNNLGSGWLVQPAMRYGSPSIETALKGFRAAGIKEITVFPLYPQYSLAATESCVLQCRRLARQFYPDAQLKIVQPFYDQPFFIDSFVQVAKASLEGFPFDHMLFSFHGLPERQVKKTDTSGSHCLSQETCCSEIKAVNLNCYRAQCYSTARQIAARLGIESGGYTVCFQSRLGNTPWIRPYTDVVYQELPKRGMKRIAVMCPAFVADCLETLEEVQIRGKADFIRYGGEELRLVPSLNSTHVWVKAVSDWVENLV